MWGWAGEVKHTSLYQGYVGVCKKRNGGRQATLRRFQNVRREGGTPRAAESRPWSRARPHEK